MKAKAIILTAILFPSICTNAQEETKTYNENVIVTGKYRPEIEMMNKVNVAPSTIDTSTALQHTFTYPLHPQRMTSLFMPSQIKAARIIAEPKNRLYTNYLRLGMGNYWSPLAEFYYNSTSNRLTTYGIMLQHHSSWGSLGDKDNDAEYYGANHSSQTALDLFGQHLYKGRQRIYGSIHYDNDYNMYYGFADTTINHYRNGVMGWPADSVTTWRDSIDNSDLRSMYHYVMLTVGLQQPSDNKNDWYYDANLNIADLAGSQGHNEFHTTLAGVVSRKLDLPWTQQIKKPMVAMQIQWHQLRQSFDLKNLPPYFTPTGATNEMNETQNRTLVDINPYATFVWNEFIAHIGATLAINHYTSTYSTKTHLLPDITISRSLASDQLTLTLGAQGNESPNTWNQMRMANPYAIGNSDLRAMRLYSFYLAAHYKIVKRLHLDAKISHNRYHDYMTYELDHRFALQNVFQPKYESFRQTIINTDLTFVNDEMISLTLGANYYKGAAIDGDTLPGLYHPEYDIHLTTHINYNNKWLFHLQGLLLAELNADYAKDAATGRYVVTETIPMRCHFNAEVEYRHNRALSFFLRLENIAGQRYNYWLHCPSQRLRCTLGATYTF